MNNTKLGIAALFSVSLLVGCKSTAPTEHKTTAVNQKTVDIKTPSAAKELPTGAVKVVIHDSIHSHRLLQKNGVSYVKTAFSENNGNQYLLPGDYRLVFKSNILVGEASVNFTIKPDQKAIYLHVDTTPDQLRIVYWISEHPASSAIYTDEKLSKLCLLVKAYSSYSSPNFEDYAFEACNGISGIKSADVEFTLGRLYSYDTKIGLNPEKAEMHFKTAADSGHYLAIYELEKIYKKNQKFEMLSSLMAQFEESSDPEIQLILANYYLNHGNNKDKSFQYAMSAFKNGNLFATHMLIDHELQKLKPDYIRAQALLNILAMNTDSIANLIQYNSLISNKISEDDQNKVNHVAEQLTASIVPSATASMCLKGINYIEDIAGKEISYTVNELSKPTQLKNMTDIHLKNLFFENKSIRINFIVNNEIVWIEETKPNEDDSPHMCVVWNNIDITPQRFSNVTPQNCNCTP